MSDQAPFSDKDHQALTPPPANQDKRELRRMEREERRARRASSGTPWIAGVILILLGIIFLLQNVRGFYLNNWWALFILLPAFGSFATAWNSYHQTGRLNRRVRGALISGCVFLLITAAFLFNLNWGLVLPILLIVWGISLLLNSLLPE